MTLEVRPKLVRLYRRRRWKDSGVQPHRCFVDLHPEFVEQIRAASRADGVTMRTLIEKLLIRWMAVRWAAGQPVPPGVDVRSALEIRPD